VTSDVSNNVREIDPRTNRVVRTVRMLTDAGTPLSVAVGDGSVWVTDFTDNRLLRIDPATGRVVAAIRVNKPTDVAVASKGVWVVDHGASSVARVDPATNRASVLVRDISSVPERVAVGFGSVWVSDPRVSSVFRLQERTAARQATIRLPHGLPVYEEARGLGTLWVAAGPRLFAVDPRTDSIAGSVEIGSPNQGGQGIGALAVVRLGVWVTSLQGDLYLVAPPEATSAGPTP
jgi:streptogramin lyase